jgi:hypothetical protein
MGSPDSRGSSLRRLCFPPCRGPNLTPQELPAGTDLCEQPSRVWAEHRTDQEEAIEGWRVGNQAAGFP